MFEGYLSLFHLLDFNGVPTTWGYVGQPKTICGEGLKWHHSTYILFAVLLISILETNSMREFLRCSVERSDSEGLAGVGPWRPFLYNR
jgi:hypothetical protein